MRAVKVPEEIFQASVPFLPAPRDREAVARARAFRCQRATGGTSKPAARDAAAAPSIEAEVLA